MSYLAETWTVKMKSGKYLKPVQITRKANRLYFKFPFDRYLMGEIKVMEGAKYHGYDETDPKKEWSVLDTPRNRFQLDYLCQKNPYAPYDAPLVEYIPKPRLHRDGLRYKHFTHQVEMIQHGLTRRQCELAAEMGTGKTLAAIEIMEASGFTDWLWFGTKGSIYSVQNEFRDWRAKIQPEFYTYDALRKLVTNWEDREVPHGVIFDEASRLKNPTSQRSIAAQWLADRMREAYGRECYIIEMSGSPAPKSPLDWWKQCEVACPGFLKEGNIHKFKNRLAIIEQKEGFEGGGIYPHLVSWKDSEDKCEKCGKAKDDVDHDAQYMADNPDYHQFTPMVNEVAKLYDRMRGLVLVKFKRDCLDLPEKEYKIIECPPSQSTLQAAGLIMAGTPSAAQALILLRELSDGFQYVKTPIGEETCWQCHGQKTIKHPVAKNYPYADKYPGTLLIWYDEGTMKGRVELRDEFNNHVQPEGCESFDCEIDLEEVACEVCNGTGKIVKYHTEAKQVPCPKEQVVVDLLEDHDEVGRIVIYGGFTGSVDRITSIVQRQRWKFIRADGRGWITDLEIGMKPTEMLEVFQERQNEYPRIAFVGHPGAAGMGLNLTASPTVLYYSNDFNAESRIQSEDRIHRPGMDKNRGATIIDLIHLPTDLKVLQNLKAKKRLQDMTMGELSNILAREHLGPRNL